MRFPPHHFCAGQYFTITKDCPWCCLWLQTTRMRERHHKNIKPELLDWTHASQNRPSAQVVPFRIQELSVLFIQNLAFSQTALDSCFSSVVLFWIYPVIPTPNVLKTLTPTKFVLVAGQQHTHKSQVVLSPANSVFYPCQKFHADFVPQETSLEKKKEKWKSGNRKHQ